MNLFSFSFHVGFSEVKNSMNGIDELIMIGEYFLVNCFLIYFPGPFLLGIVFFSF